ncbi:MAG TPA: BTAD domain-containing putative transcriptional regulator [Catenuloplanes sp.]
MLFRVLGPIEVDGSESAVHVSAGKPRRLLSLLLLHANAWVAVDSLIEELWPDGPPASAAGNIKTYVSQLRQLLASVEGGTTRIERRPGAYRIRVARTEMDAIVFEDLVGEGLAALERGDPTVAVSRLTDALALWRGEAYESVQARDADSATARLNELRWTAKDSLAVALTAAGRPGEAITILRRLATVDPLREPTWKHLMEALHAAGRRAEALAAYQDARRVLVEELGVEPGAELQQLHHRLLSDEVPAEPVPAEPVPATVPDGRTPTALPDAVPPVSPPAQRPPAAGRWIPRNTRTRRLLAVLGVAVLAAGTAIAVASNVMSPARTPTAVRGAGGMAAAVGPSVVGPGVPPKRPVPLVPAARGTKLLFGMGGQANAAQTSELVRETPTFMLTTWFHAPKDLEQLRGWRSDLVPRAYQQGYTMHLVLANWDDGKERAIDTKYGPGCGRAYLLSPEFLQHARELAQVFAGRAEDPPLYVTVFHGVNVYGCTDSSFNPDPGTNNYLRALRDRYFEIREMFHQEAPNARVAIGWQGWQANHDIPAIGGGRSMFVALADALQASDFQSAIVWQPEDNIGPVRQMVQALGQYGPVMVSYGNSHMPPATYERDVKTLLTESSLADLSRSGMFAMTFSSSRFLSLSRPAHDMVKAAVARHGGRVECQGRGVTASC